MAEFRERTDKNYLRDRDCVRNLFWEEWDPIGVNDVPQAKDEYDRYADRAYAMLMLEHRSPNEIADYLYYISSEYMGLGASQRLRDLANETANKLVALRPSFDAKSS